MESTEDLLEAIVTHWTESHHDLAKNGGQLLRKAVKDNPSGITQLCKDRKTAPHFMDAFNHQ